jgi:hypothetical protein
MELKSKAHNSWMFTEGNDSKLVGRYGWVEGLVNRCDGIPAPIENLDRGENMK